MFLVFERARSDPARSLGIARCAGSGPARSRPSRRPDAPRNCRACCNRRPRKARPWAPAGQASVHCVPMLDRSTPNSSGAGKARRDFGAAAATTPPQNSQRTHRGHRHDPPCPWFHGIHTFSRINHCTSKVGPAGSFPAHRPVAQGQKPAPDPLRGFGRTISNLPSSQRSEILMPLVVPASTEIGVFTSGAG